MWPQITLIVILCLGFGWSCVDHGKPRKPENAWVTLFKIAALSGILWWGGWWNGLTS